MLPLSTAFPAAALTGLERSLNTHAEDCTHLFQVEMRPHYCTMTVQESASDILCVHLHGNGEGSSLVVGNPTLDLRVRVANFLASVAQHWHFVGFPTEGAKAAAVGCYDGVDA
jgi:hypothetical protein